ncbi:ATP-binding protein [Methylophaga sulfidovorans]|uniref:histidine kinase n=1 Tax=Methylophaga sulfidovorans TaxID=45496 RepID=A0A1I3Z3Y3_9GAMM|nr:ATP-binding protein [Methylophaga sulfidovorans]SFK38720.1 Signal transduction histidine kinase [Methylophaga sulfidovorans]
MKGSLRNKLLLSVLLVTSILCLIIGPFMYHTIKSDVKEILDDRLAASAKMLSNIVHQYDVKNEKPSSSLTNELLQHIEQKKDNTEIIVCNVTRIDGELIISTEDGNQDVLTSVKDGYSFIRDNGTIWRVFKLTEHGISVTTAEKLDKRRQLFNIVLIGVLIPWILAVLTLIISLYFIIQRVFKPMTQLQDHFDKHTGNSLTPIEIEDVPSEVKGVIAGFNALLARVKAVLESERRFTADAAHELRTPLAGITTQLQVAMLKQGETVDNNLKQANLAVKQLTELLDQLLMLARLDAEQMASITASSTANEITSKALLPLQHMIQENQIQIHKIIHSEQDLFLPQELVVVAIRNVIKNAIQFSSAEQSVSILVTEQPDYVTWQITDEAGGIDPDLLPNVTNRFVHDKKKGNFGLGLSISKAVIDILNGKLTISNTKAGLRVDISLPYSSHELNLDQTLN